MVQTVEILIVKGADLNSLNAVRNCHFCIFINVCKIDVLAIFQRLQSPIHISAEMGHTDICKLLLAAGADIEQREQGGRTPLYIAARGSFTAIVDMIIKTARLDYPSHVSENLLIHTLYFLLHLITYLYTRILIKTYKSIHK